jgi:hypothetical protein
MLSASEAIEGSVHDPGALEPCLFLPIDEKPNGFIATIHPHPDRIPAEAAFEIDAWPAKGERAIRGCNDAASDVDGKRPWFAAGLNGSKRGWDDHQHSDFFPSGNDAVYDID